MENKQPVVILGLRKQALPIVRAFSKIPQCDIYLLSDTRTLKEEAEYTRYGEKIQFCSVSDIQSKLADIQNKYSSTLHIFIIAAYLLTEIREKFRAIYTLYNVYSSPLKWIDIFTDKAAMYSFVREYGIEIAPFILLSQYTHDSLKFPLVLKRNIEHYLSFKTKIVNNEREFDEFVSKMPDDKKCVIVQELVCGEQEMDLSYQGYLCNGKIKGRLVLEEVRHYPEGISCFLREIEGELQNKVIKDSETFLNVTDYSGFIQIDYKYLPLQKRLVIMDINTRTPASHSAFCYKFVNYNQLFTDLDEPPILQPRCKLLKWINVSSDIKCNIREHNYKGFLDVMSAKWDIWSWRDPLPFLVSMFQPFINFYRNHVRSARN